MTSEAGDRQVQAELAGWPPRYPMHFSDELYPDPLWRVVARLASCAHNTERGKRCGESTRAEVRRWFGQRARWEPCCPEHHNRTITWTGEDGIVLARRWVRP
jgi:hypothetical protein